MIGYEDHAKRATALTLVDEPFEHVHSPQYHRKHYQFLKRLMDIVVSFVALIVLFPVFLIISAIIAITEGLPVAFKQTRVGLHGKPFQIYKFRTMVRNAEEVLKKHPELLEEYKKYYKITNDPRISKIGKFLRKSSLDELPQLLNVLKGEMSLVGPRPIVPPELEMYGEHQDVYLSMKPGCAGLWQCGGRSSTSYEERVALDREYFERASFRYDFKVIFRTIGAMITGRGAR